MRYLVCQQKGNLSKVSVVSGDDTSVQQPFEAWVLNSGRRILCVERRLHKDLERHHLGGSYQAGALYAFEYDEMVAVLEEKLGEHDRHRYERLKAAQDEFEAEIRSSKHPRLAIFSAVSWGLVQLFATVLFKTVKMLVFLTIVPIIIGVVRAMSHRR